jgi:hypothetical protein
VSSRAGRLPPARADAVAGRACAYARHAYSAPAAATYNIVLDGIPNARMTLTSVRASSEGHANDAGRPPASSLTVRRARRAAARSSRRTL